VVPKRALYPHSAAICTERSRKEAAEYGLDISNSLNCEELPTSTYLCLCDEKGDMRRRLMICLVINRLTPAVFIAEKGNIEKTHQFESLTATFRLESLDLYNTYGTRAGFCRYGFAAKAEKA
jgi:hypothetical protein